MNNLHLIQLSSKIIFTASCVVSELAYGLFLKRLINLSLWIFEMFIFTVLFSSVSTFTTFWTLNGRCGYDYQQRGALLHLGFAFKQCFIIHHTVSWCLFVLKCPIQSSSTESCFKEWNSAVDSQAQITM